MEETLKEMMPDKMTADLYLFGLFVEDIIMSNLNGTPIVTVDRSSRKCGHIQIL